MIQINDEPRAKTLWYQGIYGKDEAGEVLPFTIYMDQTEMGFEEFKVDWPEGFPGETAKEREVAEEEIIAAWKTKFDPEG